MGIKDPPQPPTILPNDFYEIEVRFYFNFGQPDPCDDDFINDDFTCWVRGDVFSAWFRNDWWCTYRPEICGTAQIIGIRFLQIITPPWSVFAIDGVPHLLGTTYGFAPLAETYFEYFFIDNDFEQVRFARHKDGTNILIKFELP